jgi:hypothetical protein
MHFEPLSQSFVSRFSQYPPSHPNHPHPVLLNAMYLMAIFYLSSARHPSRPQFKIKWNSFESEMMFLSKARKAMAKNFANRENLLDALVASSLLTKYLYCTIRQVEGHSEATGA